MVLHTVLIFTITASVVILAAVAVAVVRAANRLNPPEPEPERSAEFWREAARECEKEWSASHRSID